MGHQLLDKTWKFDNFFLKLNINYILKNCQYLDSLDKSRKLQRPKY